MSELHSEGTTLTSFELDLTMDTPEDQEHYREILISSRLWKFFDQLVMLQKRSYHSIWNFLDMTFFNSVLR